ncbi:MAG: DNA polymerase III subunit delta' [Deltaproteobacteria bacterium]|nr:DNA polymerase III subunit delta' [Deltaproteobacteria bacterium]
MAEKTPFIPFSQILGQERAIGFLKRVMAMEKIPHAYLFVGIRGVGKTTTARALTQAIDCHEPRDGEGCGTCPACRQIMSGNFPDFAVLAPDGQNIKIEQIRELGRAFSFKPLSGRYRVTVIRQAETMTEEAANSFLKTLEEPAEGNILILNVTEPLNLLPTIVSRCQKVSFRPIPLGRIREWLTEKMHMDPEAAAVLAHLSEGSLGWALERVDTDFLERRRETLSKLMALPGLPTEEALEMASEVAAREKDGEGNRGGRAEGALVDVLRIWKTWYRDLLLVKMGAEDRLLMNADFHEALKKESKGYTIENLAMHVLTIAGAERDLSRSRNADLLMENTVLALRRGANGPIP